MFFVVNEHLNNDFYEKSEKETNIKGRQCMSLWREQKLTYNYIG